MSMSESEWNVTRLEDGVKDQKGTLENGLHNFLVGITKFL